MKIPNVDGDMCIGCTLCTQICPNVYRMNEDGKCEVVNPEGDSIEQIEQSVEACPIRCIKLIEK